MANADTKAAKSEADKAKAAESKAKTEDKPKRKTLTPAERVAKLEAELAAAREKANSRFTKRIEQAKTRRAALIEKRDGITKIIDEVEAEIAELEKQAGQVEGNDDDTDENAA